MSPITFDNVPSNLRVPGVYSEAKVVKTGSGLPVKTFKGLLVGSKSSAGTMANLAEPALVTNSDQVGALAGFGSLLHEMALAWFASNRSTPCSIIAVDDSAGTAGIWSITTTVTTAVAGSIYLYIAGHRIVVPVTAAQAQNAIATAIKAAIDAEPNLPVTAGTVTANAFNITAKNKGAVGLDIDVRLNYQAGEVTAGGVTVAIVNSTPGATNPTYGASLWTAIGEVQYDVIAFGHSDTANLAAIDTELRSRWGSTRKCDGRGVVGYRGTFAQAQAAGLLLNSEFLFVMPMKNSPTWTPAIGAALAARLALHHSADPSLPVNQRELDYVLAPIAADRYIFSEQNSLLFSGMSTFNVAQDGSVLIGRAITTYQKNSSLAADTGWMDSTTVFAASYARWLWDTTWSSKFPRVKYSTDERTDAAGVLTLSAVVSEFTAIYQQLIDGGHCENMQAFRANLIVQQNGSDPTRIDAVVPLYFTNPIHVVAVQFLIEL